jgi:hypothetical protein
MHILSVDGKSMPSNRQFMAKEWHAHLLYYPFIEHVRADLMQVGLCTISHGIKVGDVEHVDVHRVRRGAW